MPEEALWSWMALLFLGAFHGINPGMGWLFAVALGMQERRQSAVWRALIPLTLGHALAIGGVILLAVLAGVVVPVRWLKVPVAVLLVGLGAYHLIRHRHPNWGGMRVGMGRLTVWSFLMASAHGAGLMVLPIFLGMAAPVMAAGGHAAHAAGQGSTFTGLVATAVHGTGYLLVTAALAWVFYEKLGLGLLRKAWINLDLIWAAALITTGALTVVIW